MLIGIVLMTMLGAAVVVLIGWLSSRTSRVLRVTGAFLAGIVTIYCLIYVVALLADNWGDAANLRVGGALALVVFGATAAGAVYAAFRGLQPRPSRLM